VKLFLPDTTGALAAAVVGAACFGLGAARCAPAIRSGTALPRPPGAAESTTGPRLMPCDDAIPGSEALTAPLVLVGEIHGSAEIPAAFGNLVCHALRRRPRETVLVGLEIFSSAQSAIDAFLASDGGGPARAALLEHDFWRREYQDGRSSGAMLALLDALRGYGAGGGTLAVRALDPPRFDSANDRDAAMAKKRDERYANAQQFLQALDWSGGPSSSSPTGCLVRGGSTSGTAQTTSTNTGSRSCLRRRSLA